MSGFNEWEIRTSRKVRPCSYCGEDILAGDRYCYMRGLDSEGQIGSWSLHTECREATEQMDPGDEWWEGEQKRGLPELK